MQIIGVRFLDFKASDGKQISGVNIWATEERHNVHGLVAEKFFLSSQNLNYMGINPSDIVVGANMTVMYNRYGKVVECSID